LFTNNMENACAASPPGEWEVWRSYHDFIYGMVVPPTPAGDALLEFRGHTPALDALSASQRRARRAVAAARAEEFNERTRVRARRAAVAARAAEVEETALLRRRAAAVAVIAADVLQEEATIRCAIGCCSCEEAWEDFVLARCPNIHSCDAILPTGKPCLQCHKRWEHKGPSVPVGTD
jgi:hypothetical protein